jgi:hypothetical protein
MKTAGSARRPHLEFILVPMAPRSPWPLTSMARSVSRWIKPDGYTSWTSKISGCSRPEARLLPQPGDARERRRM